MKHITVIVYKLFIIVCFILMWSCSYCKVKPPDPPTVIQLESSVDYQLDKSGTELDMKLEFHSDIMDDAYLILQVEKLCQIYSPAIFEGFRDSLRIDGFKVRSYSIYYFYNIDSYSIDTVGTPVDYPIYIKKLFVKKGKNNEDFKIVFPRNITSNSAKIRVWIGIVRFNDEIKRNFEKFPEKYQYSSMSHNIANNYKKFYLNVFPDSSNTSLVFSNFSFIEEMSWLSGNEAPTVTSTCGFPAKDFTFNFPEYRNFDVVSFFINH